GLQRPREIVVIFHLVDDELIGADGTDEAQRFTAVIEPSAKIAGDRNGAAIGLAERAWFFGDDRKTAGGDNSARLETEIRAIEVVAAQIERARCGAVEDFDEAGIGGGGMVHDFVDDQALFRCDERAGVTDRDGFGTAGYEIAETIITLNGERVVA